jgi:hypothetical protein
MEREQERHLIQVRNASLKRLRVLEVKEARFGVDIAAHILVELDELREKIGVLDAQLGNTVSAATSAPAATAPLQQIEIVCKGRLDTLSSEVQQAAIRAFAAIMEIPPDMVRVVAVTQGSIKYLLEVPAEAAERMLAVYEDNGSVLRDLDIEYVQILGREPAPSTSGSTIPSPSAQPPKHAARTNVWSGIAVAGSVYASLDVEERHRSIAEALEHTRVFLLAHDYAAARDGSMYILEVEPTNALAKLFAAIAILDGKYADRLAADQLRIVEAHLLGAATDPALTATAWAILGIITIDVDVQHARRTMQYKLIEITAALNNAGRESIDQDLLALVRTTPRAVRRLLP